MGMLHLRVEPSGSQQAKVAGMLRPATKALGLSFGDPACFAVARINTATALATIGSGLNCRKLWASQCSCCAEKREPQRGTARGTDAGGGADTFVRSFLRLAAQRSRPAPSLHRPRASRYRRDRHGHLQSNDRLRARCQDQDAAECDVTVAMFGGGAVMPALVGISPSLDGWVALCGLGLCPIMGALILALRSGTT